MTRLSLALLLLLTACSPLAHAQGGTVSSSYMQTFDGMPATPAAYRPPGWDVQIHARDNTSWAQVEPMVAQHGPACEGPPATHALGGDYPSHVFQCHDHLMTALNATGYGLIALTPPALADFSQGEAVIRWDMSTLRTSDRDWVSLVVSPVADHLALPLDASFPDLAGGPRNGLDLSMATFRGADGAATTAFGANAVLYQDGTALPWGGAWWLGYEQALAARGLAPDAARRDTFEVRLSRTHLKVWMPQYNLIWSDADFPQPLTWTQGVVQFGHHSYNPSKECPVMVPAVSCAPNTWHWDNVSISPHVPFQITALSPRALSDQAPGGWAFPAPAPADTWLQFAAHNAPGFEDWVTNPGTPSIDLSWDGGTAWQTVRPQWSTAPEKDRMGARSYWVPVPAGATRVEVRGQGGYWGTFWQAQDASLWQLSGLDVPPTPVPVPSLPPTATPPPDVPATATPPRPTPTPTAPPTFLPTPTGGASPTLVPTRSPVPVATATPAASLPPPDPSRPCQVPVARFGVLTWKDASTSQCR